MHKLCDVLMKQRLFETEVINCDDAMQWKGWQLWPVIFAIFLLLLLVFIQLCVQFVFFSNDGNFLFWLYVTETHWVGPFSNWLISFGSGKMEMILFFYVYDYVHFFPWNKIIFFSSHFSGNTKVSRRLALRVQQVSFIPKFQIPFLLCVTISFFFLFLF